MNTTVKEWQISGRYVLLCASMAGSNAFAETITTTEIENFLATNSGYDLPVLTAGKIQGNISSSEWFSDFNFPGTGCNSSSLQNVVWSYGFYVDSTVLDVPAMIKRTQSQEKSLAVVLNETIDTKGVRYIRGNGRAPAMYEIKKLDGRECRQENISFDIKMMQDIDIRNDITIDLRPRYVSSFESSDARPQVAYSLVVSSRARATLLGDKYYSSAYIDHQPVALGQPIRDTLDTVSEAVEHQVTTDITEAATEAIASGIPNIISFAFSLFSLDLFGAARSINSGFAYGVDVNEAEIKEDVFEAMTGGAPLAMVGLSAYTLGATFGATKDKTSDVSAPSVSLPTSSEITDEFLKKIQYSLGVGTQLCGMPKDDREQFAYALLVGDNARRQQFVLSEAGCSTGTAVAINFQI